MLAAAVRAREAASACAQAPVWPLSDADLDTVLDHLDAAARAVAAATAHVVAAAEARDLPAARHCSSTEVWLRERLLVSAPAARRMVVLARALPHRPGLDAALSCGAVNAEQAQVIAAAVADLPDHVGADVTERAQAALVGYAETFEPAILGKLATRILDQVAPDLAEAAEADLLARQETRARTRRAFTLTAIDAGQVRVTGWLDTEAAAVVAAAIDPLCAPLPDDQRTPGQRRADALTEVCHLAMACGDLPANGGDRPHLVVTITADTLLPTTRDHIDGHTSADGGGIGYLDTGGRLSAAQVRRIACDAHILPAVLGSHSQLLDLGQTRRLFTGAVRRALALRDGGCAFPGCDRPPRWCHAHHIRSWLDGGPTNLDNGVLLCGFHHRHIHTSDWTIHLGPDHKPDFIPPKWLDPQQRPRRNPYHLRR